MTKFNRIGWRLVAGVGVVALVGCAGNKGGNSQPATPSTPSLSQQPHDLTVTANTAATFTVAATGNGTLTYQWQKNGTAINAATTPSAATGTLTLPAAAAADAGAYTCRVTNTVGASSSAVTSSAAMLIVNVPPTIDVQPPASTPDLVVGGSATFTVAASGNGALTYRWQKNGVNLDAVANPSAATATLALANLKLSDAGTYTCVVTATLNGTTSTTVSAAAVLGIGQLPTLTAQPLPLETVVLGAPATFTVAAAAATQSGTLAYQWLKDGTALDAGANPSAASATLTLAAVAAGDAGAYTCAITDTEGGLPGTVVTAQGVLAVNVPPQVSPVANQTGGQGGTATFSVTATGNGVLSYLWLKNGAAIDPAANASAATATLLLSNLQASPSDTYACVVTNTLNGTLTSTTATTSLTVNPAPTLTTVAAQTGIQGGGATFTVSATQVGTLSYQWLKNGVAIDPAANASAATATLALTNLAAADDQSTYSVKVSDNAGGVLTSSTSNAAVLSVNKLPVLSTDAGNQGYTLGTGTASFTVAATGNGTLSYQWYKGAPGSGTVIAAPQGTAATLALTGLLAGDAGSTYYCVVTSTLNATTITTTSATATLVLGSAPTLTTQPAVSTVVLGSPATFSVAATGSGSLAYQWFKGTPGSGTAIAGATSATYTTPATAQTNAGDSYYCVVSSVIGASMLSTTSTAAIVAVNWAPVWDVTSFGPPAWASSSPAAALQGGTASMANWGPDGVSKAAGANPTVGTAAFAFQWYKDGVAIAAGVTPGGGTLSFLNNQYASSFAADSSAKITTVQPGDGGVYTCVVTRTLNGTAPVASVLSAGAKLFVLATPVITAQPAPTTVAQGANATFSLTVAAPANGTLYYQWYKGPTGSGTPIAGATTPSLTLTSVKATDTASTYWCKVSNKDVVNAPASLVNAVNSGAVALTVTPVVAVPVVTIDPSVPDSAPDLLASTQDQGPLVTYAWTIKDKNGANLITSGATSRTVTYAAPTAANGPVTASVTVTSTADATFATGTGTATVKSVAFVDPDLIAPPLVHPNDNWMKAFTTQRTGETYAWSYLNGTTAKGGTWTGSATTSTLAFYANNTQDPMDDTFTLSLNGQLNGDNATNTARVRVKTGVWVTKDGSASAVIGPYATATTLPSGRVLITGGQAVASSSGQATSANCFIYDPGTGRLVPTGALNTARAQHTATLLDNGQVLVAGGMNVVSAGTSSSSFTTTYLNSAELWDPATGTWSAVPSMLNARVFHCAYKYTNGTSKVAIIGGTNNGGTSGNVLAIEIFNPVTQTWSTGPNLQIGRYQHTLTPLTNDTVNNRAITDAGKVLILGGQGGSGSTIVTTNAQAQPELFDPVALTTAKTANMVKVARYQHTATRLKDGNVVIVGGAGTTPMTAGNTAEIFDPGVGATGTGTFTQIGGATGTPVLGGPLAGSSSGRAQHTADLLPDGTVLIAGGRAVGGAADKTTANSVELFTPSGAPTSGGTFSYSNAAPGVTGITSSLHEGHYAHPSAALPSGQVALVGGQTLAQTLNVSNLVELYTPANGTTPASITVAAGLDTGRLFHQSVQLANQKILVMGGIGTLAGAPAGVNYSYANLDSCRIFDPTSQTWTTTGNLNIPRKDFAAVLLPNGCVLVTGGKTILNAQGDTSAELWNPAANDGLGAWTLLPSYLNTARALHSMVVLQDGRVLVMGGGNGTGGLATCEIYADGVFTQLPASGSMSEGKGYLTPILLSSGKVVIAGGVVNPLTSGAATGSAQVEVFDPTTNTWNKNLNPLQTARGFHNTILLPSGKLALLGGMTTVSSSSGVFAGIDPVSYQPVAGTATETYDLTLNSGNGGSYQWSPGVYSSALWTGDGHRFAQAVLLTSGPNSGKVLVLGGPGATFNGAPPAFSTASGTVCEIYDPATDTFTATDSLPVARKYNIFSGSDSSEFTVHLYGGTNSVNKSDVVVIGGALSGGTVNVYRP